MSLCLVWIIALAATWWSSAQAADTSVQIGTVIALSYSTNGNLLAAGDAMGHLAVYRIEDGAPAASFARRELTDGIPDRILALRFSPDDKRLVVASEVAVQIFDATSGTKLRSIPYSTTIATLSADSAFVAFREDDRVTVLDVSSGQKLYSFATALGYPATLAFSPDRRLLAVGARETIITVGAPPPPGVPSGDLEVFDLPSGHLQVLKAVSPWFSSVGFSLDSSRVAAITFAHVAGTALNDYRNTALNLWEISSGDPALQEALRDDTSFYSFLSFVGSSGTIVATSGASWGGDIAIIDTGNGRITHGAPFDIGAIFSAALAPSGHAVAIGMLRGVQVREIPSRRLLMTIGLPPRDRH
jgi:WD40 repeat protein